MRTLLLLMALGGCAAGVLAQDLDDPRDLAPSPEDPGDHPWDLRDLVMSFMEAYLNPGRRQFYARGIDTTRFVQMRGFPLGDYSWAAPRDLAAPPGELCRAELAAARANTQLASAFMFR